jgi:prevent-host-death family protein
MNTITFSAKEAKNNFGRLLDEARRVPVTIEKNGRKVAVMLSLEEYRFLEALSDAYWAKRAEEAEKDGTIGVKASERYLASVLKNEKRTLKAGD